MLKTLIITAFLLARGQFAQAQDQPKRAYEAGVEVVNYNPLGNGHRYGNSPANTPAQWASGVVFRYIPNRLGLRLGGNFSQGTIKSGLENCNDCPVGKSTDRELKLKVGAQYVPFTKESWLYVFTDAYYRWYSATGDYTGGFCGCLDYTEARALNGVGVNAGIGGKARIFKSFYLSPEIYYDVLRERGKTTYENHNTGGVRTYSQSATMHRPAMRLQAIVAF